jgi:hypothetical protein
MRLLVSTTRHGHPLPHTTPFFHPSQPSDTDDPTKLQLPAPPSSKPKHPQTTTTVILSEAKNPCIPPEAPQTIVKAVNPASKGRGKNCQGQKPANPTK